MPVFVDTNVLVYARDASEPDKQPQAAAWIEHLWRTRTARPSLQVVQEYDAATTRNLKAGLDPAQARTDVRDLLAWRPLPVGSELLEAAWSVEDRFGLSCWDALIVAAAELAGCEHLRPRTFTTERTWTASRSSTLPRRCRLTPLISWSSWRDGPQEHAPAAGRRADRGGGSQPPGGR